MDVYIALFVGLVIGLVVGAPLGIVIWERQLDAQDKTEGNYVPGSP
jgi:hypothetical protein